MRGSNSDTIYALSSGRAKGGVAVIRLSGSECRFVCETICGRLPFARQAALVPIRRRNGELLDRAIALRFEAPNSFSGEDMLELHVHGSKAVIDAVIDELTSFSGVRLADAGEFTLRAFQNGKLDLAEAEGLADLIDADTEAQRRLALRQLNGDLSSAYAGWRERLLTARALIEAAIDFSDEGDVDDLTSSTASEELGRLVIELKQYLAGFRRSHAVRDGFHVALVGRPNVGKSSLLNALVERDAAIVSDEPGTTRDVIEAALDLGGFKVIFSDTAGIRDAASKVEAIGVGRARARAEEADLVLELVLPGDIPLFVPADTHWIVSSKSDLFPEGVDGLAVSAHSGDGVSDLLSRIQKHVTDVLSDGAPAIVQDRHRRLIEEAVAYLGEALQERQELEIQAELVRYAADRIAEITGEIGTEDMLGAIFSRFCIGK